MTPMHAGLLGQADPVGQFFDQLGAAFRQEGTAWPLLVRGLGIGLLAILVALPLGLLVRGVIRRVRPTAGPESLFRAALRVCGVPATDSWLLQHIARRLELTNPTALLLAQPLYQDITKEGIKRMPSALRDWARRRLEQVEATLFVEEEATAPTMKEHAPAP